MKLRYLLFLLIATLLSACNFSLAADVTPPPGYIPPTPMPTLVLVPSQAPNLANGAAIYVEKCAACHGDSGLGDGAQGLQLPVPVKAFGLADIARSASPAQYFTSVTRGNLDRYMPPFNSLTDQQRWDVIAYVLTLHTTPEQIAQGKELFKTNCAGCATDFFKDQSQMSSMSEVELARLIRLGGDAVPAFGSDFNDDDLWATAAYLRTLSFDTTPLTQVEPASATSTPISADASTAAAQAIPAEAGTVQGSIVNKTGAALPPDLVVTLHGFDHVTGENAGAQEVFTQDATLNADGTYTIENVDLPEGRIFLAEAAYSGITLKSELGIVATGQTSLTLPAITLYAVTEDTSALIIEQLHLFVQAGDNGSYEIIALYNFRNPSDRVITVNMTADQQEIPFLKFPTGAQAMGYEAVQDSAPLISLDNGFAMSPSDQTYGIMAFSTISTSNITLTQELALAARTVRIFAPEGMNVTSDQLSPEQAQDFQGTAYQSYIADNLNAGDSLTFELSGTPTTVASARNKTSFNNNLLIGAGVLGFVLILAGVWMYLRDRNLITENEEDDDETEFSSSEEVLDAILALDDLHRAKKISDETHQKRRAELKEVLKALM